jgi:hypothetical protein
MTSEEKATIIQKNTDAKRNVYSQITCEEKAFVPHRRKESQSMRRYGMVSKAQRREKLCTSQARG